MKHDLMKTFVTYTGGTMDMTQPENPFSDSRTVLHLERTGNEDLLVAQMLVSVRQTCTSGRLSNFIS